MPCAGANATMNPRGQGGEQRKGGTSITRAGATMRVQEGEVCETNGREDAKQDAEHYEVCVCGRGGFKVGVWG